MRGWVLGMGVLGACHGDVTGATGDLGRLEYRLGTDYESEQEDLRDLPLITRYETWISVRATVDGAKDGGDQLSELRHRADFAEVSTSGGDVPGFTIRVDQPGDVTVESMLDDRVFDQITLTFADPDELELVVWSRDPWAEDWADVTDQDPLQAAVGTQVVFLAIPKVDGVRIGGDFTPEITVDEPSLAVPDEQVFAVQEGGVTGATHPAAFYGVGEGTATFTVSDPEHGLSTARSVTFAP